MAECVFGGSIQIMNGTSEKDLSTTLHTLPTESRVAV
jgi:hypothetical protein